MKFLAIIILIAVSASTLYPEAPATFPFKYVKYRNGTIVAALLKNSGWEVYFNSEPPRQSKTEEIFILKKDTMLFLVKRNSRYLVYPRFSPSPGLAIEYGEKSLDHVQKKKTSFIYTKEAEQDAAANP